MELANNHLDLYLLEDEKILSIANTLVIGDYCEEEYITNQDRVIKVTYNVKNFDMPENSEHELHDIARYDLSDELNLEESIIDAHINYSYNQIYITNQGRVLVRILTQEYINDETGMMEAEYEYVDVTDLMPLETDEYFIEIVSTIPTYVRFITSNNRIFQINNDEYQNGFQNYPYIKLLENLSAFALS